MLHHVVPPVSPLRRGRPDIQTLIKPDGAATNYVFGADMIEALEKRENRRGNIILEVVFLVLFFER